MLEKVKISLVWKEKNEQGIEDGETNKLKTEVTLQVENNKAIIPLKIKKIGSPRYNQPKWKYSDKKCACYSVESPPISLGEKKIKIDTLTICYGDETNEITNIEDYLFSGAEIKLGLDKKGKSFSLRRHSEQDENDNELCSLEVYSNYEIITPTNTISFPQLTYKEEEDGELKRKWDETKRGFAYERFNGIYKNKDKSQVESINLSSQGLVGSLKIENFPNLKLVNLADNQLTELKIINCPQLKYLDIQNNPHLTLLEVEKLSNFDRLITDTGTLQKNSLFNNPSEWIPKNVGNPNTPNLEIVETKKDEEKTIKNDKDKKKPLFSKLIKQIKEKKLIECENLKDFQWNELKKEEKEEIKRTIIENIKQYKDGWKVKKVLVFDWGPNQQEYENLLIHKSAKLEYNIFDNLIMDYRKMFSEKDFTGEQWQELEQTISTNNWSLKNKLLVGGGILLVIFILYLLIRKYFF